MSQIDHWADVCKSYTDVQEFFEFILRKYGLTLDYYDAEPGTSHDLRRLLDEFFEVDQTQLEIERRALLEQQRQINHERKRGDLSRTY